MARSTLTNAEDYWLSQQGSQRYSVWSGRAFEKVCLNNIRLFLDARGTSGMFQAVTYWDFTGTDKEAGAEIDILIIYKGGLYEIVECKYYNDEFNITNEYARKLKNKAEQLSKNGLKKKKHEIIVSMLTTYGSKKFGSGYSNANISNDITISDMI